MVLALCMVGGAFCQTDWSKLFSSNFLLIECDAVIDQQKAFNISCLLFALFVYMLLQLEHLEVFALKVDKTSFAIYTFIPGARFRNQLKPKISVSSIQFVWNYENIV